MYRQSYPKTTWMKIRTTSMTGSLTLISVSDDSEDLGPKDGENKQENGEADFDCYESL